MRKINTFYEFIFKYILTILLGYMLANVEVGRGLTLAGPLGSGTDPVALTHSIVYGISGLDQVASKSPLNYALLFFYN